MKWPRYLIFKLTPNRKGTKINLEELSSDEVDRIIKDAEEFDRIMTELGNCNNCDRAPSCGWAPAWGEDVRINCPLWKDKEDGADEDTEEIEG